MKRVSTLPSPLQARNFSTIQAASPAGESFGAGASVCGRVPWMNAYAPSFCCH